MDEQRSLQHADGTLNVCELLEMLDWFLFTLTERVLSFEVQHLWSGVNIQTQNHRGK